MVAVAPGAEAPADGPYEGRAANGLDSLFEAGPRPYERASGTTGTAGARTTTIDLSGTGASALPERPAGPVPLRKIVGARASSGRLVARFRRVLRVGGWLSGSAIVGIGLFTLWVLLFSTISGGDVWLGHPLPPKPNSQQQPAREAGVNPPVPSTVAPTPSAGAGSGAAKKVAAKPSPTSGKGKSSPGGSGTSGSGSGRGGADDPAGDDAGGARPRTTAPAPPATGGGSGSGSGSGGGSGSGSGGSGSSGGGGGSGGGHGADD